MVYVIGGSKLQIYIQGIYRFEPGYMVLLVVYVWPAQSKICVNRNTALSIAIDSTVLC